MLSFGLRVLCSPDRNDPRPGLYHMSGGRLFQFFVVLGKNEYLCTFILDRENAYLDLREG